jgi:hypothetical protein
MSLVVVCFLAVSGDPSHEIISFPYDPNRNFATRGTKAKIGLISKGVKGRQQVNEGEDA